MKILHTSDWHLGHRLHEQSQYEEQLRFLKWLENYIGTSQIDVLLIAGDIFDTGVPSTQSQKLYYDFLINLRNTNCKHIVITGGNHDAPGTINAPRELLNALSIHVVGKATEDIKDEVFQLSVDGEEIIIAAVPYLRDQDIRRAVAGESFGQIGDRYKTALINHYAEVAGYCESIKKPNTPIFAMGHLFAIGGTTSESEQSIYVGNLGDIGAGDFPGLFDYVALGHLHRSQKVGKLDHIRYSGSPYMLSFSEVGAEKKMIQIETKVGEGLNIEEVSIPRFRELLRISGSTDDCIGQMVEADKEARELTPWAEVVLDDKSNAPIGFAEINKAAENLDLEVLKVTLKNERKIAGLEQLIESSKHVKELSPLEVFKMKCKEQEFDLENNPGIFDAFNEVLQKVREG
ncbi:MAG: exonuclease sbcCD subunit D [Bacteroidetes bacterium]|nr:MAG: exonuclease sbcCD subunit D [Bacteroidota bacterium]